MKRILLIMMLVLCIGFVDANPKSVRVSEMQAPQNVSTGLVAGGTLSASTQYYYKVVAEGPGSNFYAMPTAMAYLSPPSAEVTNTTDTANKSIKICWEKNASAQVWMIYRTQISGDYDVYKNGVFYDHVLNGVGSSSRLDGFLESQLVVSGTRLCYTDDGDADVSYPLIENGVPIFYLEGGTITDPITPLNIYNWSINNGYGKFWQVINYSYDIEYPVALGFEGSLFQETPSTMPLYFEVPQQTYFLHKHGKMWFDEDSTFTMGKDNNITVVGAVLHSIQPYAWYSGSDGNMSLYNSMSMGAPEIGYPLSQYLQQGNQFQWYGDTGRVQKLYYSIWEPLGAGAQAAGRIDAKYWESIRNTMFVKGINMGPIDGIMSDLKLDNWISTHFAVMETTIANSEFINPDSHDLRLYNYDSQYEDEVLYSINNVYANGPQPVVWAQVRADRQGWSFMLDKKEVAFTFFYKNGSRAEGVNVTAITNDGYNDLWYDLGTDNKVSEAVAIGETSITVEDGSAFAVGDMVQVQHEVWNITNVVGNTLTVTRAMQETVDRKYQMWTNIYKRYDQLSSNATGQTETIAYMNRVWEINRTNYAGPTGSWEIMSLGGRYWDLNPINFTITAEGYQPYTMSLNVTEQCEAGCDLKIVLGEYPFIVDGTIIINDNTDTVVIRSCT